MTDATDKKIENIIDATATATDETTEEKAAATEDATTPACDCCCGVHMGEADGKTVDEPITETGADCECDEQVEHDEPVEHKCECEYHDTDTDTDTDTDKSRAEAVKEKAAEVIETAGEAVSKAGEALTTAAHAAAGEFDADETKEAAKHVVDGAATVGKNVAGVVKKFVSTLVSNGGKDDADGVKTDEKQGE